MAEIVNGNLVAGSRAVETQIKQASLDCTTTLSVLDSLLNDSLLHRRGKLADGVHRAPGSNGGPEA